MRTHKTTKAVYRVAATLAAVFTAGRIETVVVTVAFLVGVALVCVGVALIYMPAGLIVGGIALSTGSGLYARTRVREIAKENRS